MVIHKSIMNLVLIMAFIGSLLFIFSQSIRLDEAQSIWVSTKSIPTLLYVTAQDVQTPLYAIILHFWIQTLGTDIVMIRLLSIIFFVLTLPILHRFIEEASDKNIANLGVMLFSLSPFILWYSSEARTYALFTLIVSLNHLYFLRFIKSDAKRGKFGYMISSTLGLYTHYYFIFLLFTQAAFVTFFYIKDVWKLKQSNNDIFAALLGSKYCSVILDLLIIGSFLSSLFFPWIAHVSTLGLGAYSQPLLSKPTSFNLIQIFVSFLLGFQNSFIQIFIISLWPLILLFFFFIFSQKMRLTLKPLPYFIAVTFVPVCLAFILSFIKPIFLPRYLIFTTPSLFALLAWMITNYSGKYFLVTILVTFTLMIYAIIIQFRSGTTPVKEDYISVAEYVSKESKAQDVIAVSAPFTIYPIEYSYTGIAKIDTIPNWNRFKQGPIPAFHENDFIRQIDEYKKIYYRIFMVLSYDQGYEKNIRGYLDEHFELLQNTTFQSNINVRIYKLRYDEPVAI